MYMHFIKRDNPIFFIANWQSVFLYSSMFLVLWLKPGSLRDANFVVIGRTADCHIIATTFGANSDEVGIELSVLNGYI